MVCSKTGGFSTQVLLLVLLFPLAVFSFNLNSNSNGSYLADIQLPDRGFSADCNYGGSSSSSSGYNIRSLFEHKLQNRSIKLHLRHPLPPHPSDNKQKKSDSILASTLRDLNRIHTFRRRITENKKNQNSRRGSSSSANTRHLLEQQKQKNPGVGSDETVIHNQKQFIMGTLKSGVTLGSGEYLMDVYIGTPPRKFSLIVDTGSDLNWIQCVPCYDCFQQDGSFYDPLLSSSFKNISCQDPRCRLVSTPDPPGRPCNTNSSTGSNQSSCPYFYWYGDSSNTTGDFALETFTVNLTASGGGGGSRWSELRKVEDVMFGCGHWNRGLFHGAAGLLGLGRGPLSFATQLQSLYGHSFSYCLVDRYSDFNITSKLIFGEDKQLLNHPQLNFTSLVDVPATSTPGDNHTNNTATTNPAATFYYVQIKSVLIDGQILHDIPQETWRISDEDGTGGTIIDSGTTLSYFAKPAYDIIRDAFMKKISQSYNNYPLVKEFPVLDPCYNVSGVKNVEFPDFGMLFEDGGLWNFPAENNFIWINEEVVCLAILGAGKQDFSIIGNYQQQNFHVLYDIQGSKLGFAPRKCSEV